MFRNMRGTALMSRIESNDIKTDRGSIKELFGYEVVDYLGEGAGSRIYVVTHPSNKQVYALKHVTVKKDKEVRFAEQLLNEFEVGRQISHPLIRKVVEAKVTRTLLRRLTEAALIMELVDGVALDASMPTDVEAIVDIFLQVAQALQALHRAGFVHCDLKPNNILRCLDGSIKLIDLGQACAPLTVKQRIQGTPDFISPEQVKCEPVSVRTDVYNLGATLYWALCGKAMPTLFTIKRTENSFLMADNIPTPSELNPAVPQNLSAIVMDCVRIAPARRPADMGEVIRRLELVKSSMNRAAASPVDDDFSRAAPNQA